MCAKGQRGQTGPVAGWGSFSYVSGPLVAFGAVGVLALILRWSYRRGGSLVAPPPRPGRSDEYGLLVAVATPRTAADGTDLQRRLEAAGVRATVADTREGPRLMVFAADEERARSLLAAP